MAAADAEVERLYELGERLSSAKDKSEHAADYEAIIAAVKGNSVKAKQLAAQLIPRFFRSFPALATRAMEAMFDLVDMEELAIRIQAIRGFPLLGKDAEFVSKIADILGQVLASEENVERDAVHKALMSLIRQDVKNSLQPLFKHVESGSEIREKVICFLRDKVFPLKAELLKPQAEMERYITDLIKKSVQDVTGLEFKLFMNFLRSLSIFGDSAPRESFQELIEIIQAQADLDAQFNVSDIDHIERWISCMYMALPIFMRGASSSKFLNYFVKQIVPVFDKIPEEKKLDLLKTIAASSPYSAAQDSRQLLPSIVQLLKKYMPGKKVEDINHSYVECLLYTFHHLAHKTPNTTNTLCGYKIVTGQPSDRLGEDFSEQYKDFMERLTGTEETVRAASKRLTQGMANFNKAISAAKTEEEKTKLKADQQKSTMSMRAYNNILAMVQPLHAKSPLFIGDKKIMLSWMEQPKKPAAATTTGGKRSQPATNGNGPAIKKGRGEGGMHNQLVHRAFEGLSRGGRGNGRGRGRGGQGRGWGYR
ncbi:apoptosis inhibitor 5-like protein API5 isoform X2 [Phragmites australis]|uniref:apoptosis inhibitor 5-like protein API5 isoform X2 n=1 Tax=Phragmites australis TaxID=29695 RepID=UPI002D77579C|nr:apoptosis inhibitor 5-like protein API5 isoform X2 [Phragmites australis]